MTSCGSPETTAAEVFFEPTVKFAENGCSGFFYIFLQNSYAKMTKDPTMSLEPRD